MHLIAASANLIGFLALRREASLKPVAACTTTVFRPRFPRASARGLIEAAIDALIRAGNDAVSSRFGARPH